MTSANTGSLRDRRRAELSSQIQEAAYQLFAERGFAAVTTEDIAAAAGISISTYFRHAPTKEDLLIEPAREAVTEIVSSYSARPADESPVEALIQLFVTHARDSQRTMDTWYRAVLTAPHLLSQSTLVTGGDHEKFIEDVAARMGVDASVDLRPSLAVHTSLATVQFVLDRWLTADTVPDAPFHVQLEEALRITLAGFGNGVN